MQNSSGDVLSSQEKTDVDGFFSGAQRRKTVEDIKRVLAEGAQLVTVTGDEGSGKTMICQMVEKELPKNYTYVYLSNTLESFEGVLRVLGSELGVKDEEPSLSSADLVAEISSALKENNHRLLVVFDQAMYLATIERIWKLLIAVNDDAVLLQVILVGKRSMLESLKQLTVCDFKYIEEHNLKLSALGLSETYAYLNHCAQRYDTEIKDKNIFTPEAAKKIYSIAKGNFRMTTTFVEKSLKSMGPDSSFMTLLDDIIVEDMDKEVISEKKGFALPPIFKKKHLHMGLGLIALLAVLFWWGGGDDGSTPEKEHKKVEVAQVVEKKPVKLQPKKETARKKITLTEKKKDIPGEKGAEKKKVEKQETVAPVKTDSLASMDNVEEKQDKEAENKAPVETTQEEKVLQKVANLPEEKTEMEEKGDDEKHAVEEKETESSIVKETSPEKTETIAVSEPVVPKEDVAETIAEVIPVDAEESAEKQEIPVFSPTRTKVIKEGVTADDIQAVPDSQEEAIGTDTEFIAEEGESKQIAVSPLAVQREEEGDHGAEAAPVAPLPETDISEEDIVVFSDVKKKEPERAVVTEVTDAKTAQKVAPPKIVPAIIDNTNGENDLGKVLFQQRVEQGNRWLAGEMDTQFTVQLMMLSTDHGEENLIQKFKGKSYQEAADSLFVIKGSSTKLFVFYGVYPDMESARRAKEDLPSFLKAGDPYVVAIDEAVARTKEQ